MSEWKVEVVRLGKIGKHPKADTLSITTVQGHYPVICKSGELEQGQLAVHVPPDSLVPVDRPEFSWLADKAHNGVFRVKYIKLRGIPSYGFLVPLKTEYLPATPDNPVLVPVTKLYGETVREGQAVAHLLGVTKYEPPACFTLEGQGDIDSFPGQEMIPHYDIEGIRKYESLFTPGEQVWITEKIHGANGKWVYLGGKLRCGSRTKFRQNSVWNQMAEKYGLDSILSQEKYQGYVLYGEVYGPGIQDLAYGVSAGETRVLFFDIYDTKRGLWINQNLFRLFCEENGLPIVPTLYEGPFDLAACYAMAEGKSTLANHVREGIVVKPVAERWDQEIGRVFLKLPGEGYLLRKEAA